MNDDEVTTLRGPGVTLTGGGRTRVIPMTATVPMKTTNGITGFKFQDTVATYRDERDADHPLGYGDATADKHGYIHPRYSEVAGLIGGITEVTVYPEQFGMPCKPGTCYYFTARPGDFMAACVRAVEEALFPPEYMI